MTAVTPAVYTFSFYTEATEFLNCNSQDVVVTNFQATYFLATAEGQSL